MLHFNEKNCLNTILRVTAVTATKMIPFWFGCFIVTTGCFANTAMISNEYLCVKYHSSSGTFCFEDKRTGKVFVQDALRSDAKDDMPAVAIVEKTLDRIGELEALEAAYSTGGKIWIMLKKDSPFVYIQREIVNTQDTYKIVDKIPMIDAAVDLSAKAADLKALGTGGLKALNGHQGSYVFLAIAEPQTRNGVVAAWLTFDRGSGVVFSSIAEGKARLSSQVDYGRLRIAPHQSVLSEILVVGYFEDARIGLERYADHVAEIYQIHLPPQPSGYCTWYSEKHGRAGDEVYIKELADFAAKELKPFGFDFVQIDDYWQIGQRRNGPAKNFTGSNPQGPYPGGMKATADYIKSKGLTAGLWFMPFAGDHEDPFFKEHPEWFVRRTDGKPYETDWGGTSLDMTQAGARAYLGGVVNTISHQWGYKYFKMDGLWTGTASQQVYVNKEYRGDDKMADAVFSNPDKTNIEAYRDGLKFVRQAAGKDVFFLGCCMVQNLRSFGGSIGLVDAMRVGPDNNARWGGLVSGPAASSRVYFLHRRVWYNDPDPVYIRPSMPMEHSRLICSWVAVTGQLTVSSDWLPEMPADRINLLKRCMPSHHQKPRPVDLFERDIPSVWLLTSDDGDSRHHIIGYFNWRDTSQEFDYSLEQIGLDDHAEYIAYEYWSNSLLGPFKDRIKTAVDKQACQVLSVCKLTGEPFVLSTSRHITQGLMDVVEEKWNSSSGILEGASDVVAGDPYEIRISLFGKEREKWSVVDAKVSESNLKEGVAVSYSEDGNIARIKMKSPKSQRVDWTVKLKRNDSMGH